MHHACFEVEFLLFVSFDYFVGHTLFVAQLATYQAIHAEKTECFSGLRNWSRSGLRKLASDFTDVAKWNHMRANIGWWNVFRTACFQPPPPPGWMKTEKLFSFTPGWLKTVFLYSVAPPPLISVAHPKLLVLWYIVQNVADSYQYCDTLYKMWQMNNRDCNKKSTVTASTCRKRLTVNGKSQLQQSVAVNLYRHDCYSQLFPFTFDRFHLQLTFSVYSQPFIQALAVTVELFHLQLTFLLQSLWFICHIFCNVSQYQ